MRGVSLPRLRQARGLRLCGLLARVDWLKGGSKRL